MLAKRIIPCLDVTAGRVVKGVNFLELRDAGLDVALEFLDRAFDFRVVLAHVQLGHFGARDLAGVGRLGHGGRNR